MEKINYDNINEVIYKEKLANGLTIKLIPKPGYNKVFACFGTNYGSLTNKFVPYGESDYQEVPLGIAHFLEHKLFAMEDGTDAANLFTEMGLESNAYTDYMETVYLFSGTDNIEKGLGLLLDFVQKPCFTDENVESERGIIEQELLMYLDMPRDRLHNGLMENMFEVYPLRYDVGGTVEEIKKITKETLYKCYNTFYHPSNMSLIVVGDIDCDQIMNLIKNNQEKKEFPKALDIKRNFLVEDEKVVKKFSSIKMDVSIPKIAIGFKLPFEKFAHNEPMMVELYLKIILESKLGPSSEFYQMLLDEELISGSLGYSVFLDDKCGYIKVSFDSKKPDECSQKVKEFLLELRKIKLSKIEFERFKKAILGSFLKGLNNLEFIASSYIEYNFKNSDIFSSISLLESSTLKDIKKMGKYFKADALTEFVVYPKDWKSN